MVVMVSGLAFFGCGVGYVFGMGWVGGLRVRLGVGDGGREGGAGEVCGREAVGDWGAANRRAPHMCAILSAWRQAGIGRRPAIARKTEGIVDACAKPTHASDDSATDVAD